MGKIKYLHEVRKFFEKTPVASARDIKLFLKNKSYAHLLISNLIKKGEIRRLTKGFYTLHEEPSLLVFCFKPAYLGLQDALSINGLWEQETGVVVVTAKKVKSSSREVFGTNVLLHRIKPKYLFGYDFVEQGNFYFPVSDLEKTFIDFFYFRQPLDRKVFSIMKRKLDLKKLKQYLKAYPKKFGEKVLKMLG